MTGSDNSRFQRSLHRTQIPCNPPALFEECVSDDATSRLLPTYSITSSALSRIDCGTFRTKLLGGLEVEDHLDACGLLDRQVSRLSALEDAADI